MSFALAPLAEAVARHGTVWRVVVAEVQGSAPREVGAAMLVWREGGALRQSGTIGGGALEYEAAARAPGVVEDRIERQALGPALGQCCGGAVTLLTECWDSERLETIDGDVVARGPGARPLAVERLLAKARGEGRTPAPQLVEGWMVEPVSRPTRQLWIYGAGHVGRALVDVLSPLPDFALTWVDTGADRFPEVIPHGVTQLVAADPALAAAHAPREAEHLILTYSHALDLELCHRLLLRGFAGAGLIGSATKWARFQNRLRQLGHSDAQISRIRCPIGQPELGKHPQAIAVGVAVTLLRGQDARADARRTG